MRMVEIHGHRGARGLLPENTIPAFLRALELGVQVLELDTVISADGEVVVSHDPYMSATICSHPDGKPVTKEEEKDLRLYGMTYAEIVRYDCGRRRHPSFPRQQPQPASKPLLKQVIRAAEAGARELGRALPWYNVETKSTPAGDGTLHPEPEEFTRRVVAVLNEEGIGSRSILQSFDPRTLQVAHRKYPQPKRSLLVEKNYPGLGTALSVLGFVPDFFSPDYVLVDEKLVVEVHEAGMRLVPWTVNDPDAMQALVRLGADGLITDYPDVAMDTVLR